MPQGHVRAMRFQGAEAIELTSALAGSAVILLHGGHVVSWKDPEGRERLYLSPLSDLQSNKAVRGGVPVIFPQFSERGPGPRHGFARTLKWQNTATNASTDGNLSATLALETSDATLALWPETFRIELQVTLSPWALDMALTVKNTGTRAWQFAGALHTYLAVEALGSAQIGGLNGLHFEDALQGGATALERNPARQLGEAIDRIYFEAPGPFSLNTAEQGMRLVHQGWPDAVVWNPGANGAQALSDLPDEAWSLFVCIEAALIGTPPTLQPGEQWQGRQTLRAVPRGISEPASLV